MKKVTEETTAEIVPVKKNKVSAIALMATRLGCEPEKLLETLKATAFKSEKPVTNEQMMALVVVSNQYKLNPFTKEIYAFPDNKSGGIVPVVGVDGWARIVNEHPQFDGVEFDMPLDGSECTCRIFRKDREHAIEITEYFSECSRGTQPWKVSPKRMLRHKAFIQCARLAFGFAGIYDPDEAERIQVLEAEPIASRPSLTDIVAKKKEEIAPKPEPKSEPEPDGHDQEPNEEEEQFTDELPL